MKLLQCSTFIFIFRYQYFVTTIVPEWLLLKKKNSDSKRNLEANLFS